jgi:hypothetical protein
MALQAQIELRSTLTQKPGWSYYLAWILVTVLAFPVTFFLTLAILRVVIGFVGGFIYVNGVRHITEDYLALYFYIPLVGLLTGVLQFMLLRRYLPRVGWWVPATLGGWLLGVLLVALSGWLGWTDSPSGNFNLMLILMGFSIGISQWLVMQRRLPRAGWWLAANLIGWGLLAMGTPGNSVGQWGLLLVGFVPACVTALALALLVNQRELAESG